MRPARRRVHKKYRDDGRARRGLSARYRPSEASFFVNGVNGKCGRKYFLFTGIRSAASGLKTGAFRSTRRSQIAPSSKHDDRNAKDRSAGPENARPPAIPRPERSEGGDCSGAYDEKHSRFEALRSGEPGVGKVASRVGDTRIERALAASSTQTKAECFSRFRCALRSES